jgi:hypothetical protein
VTTLRQLSQNRRQLHHVRQIGADETARGQLWRACGWMAAEAARANRTGDTVLAVVGLVAYLRSGAAVPPELARAGRSVLGETWGETA